jgi:hypothetical protein
LKINKYILAKITPFTMYSATTTRKICLASHNCHFDSKNRLWFNGVKNAQTLTLQKINMTPIPTVVKGYNDCLDFCVGGGGTCTAIIPEGYYNVNTIGIAVGNAMTKVYNATTNSAKLDFLCFPLEKYNAGDYSEGEDSKRKCGDRLVIVVQPREVKNSNTDTILFPDTITNTIWNLPVQKSAIASLLGLSNKEPIFSSGGGGGGSSIIMDLPFNPISVKYLVFDFTKFSIPINIDQTNPCSHKKENVKLLQGCLNARESLVIRLENSNVTYTPNTFAFKMEIGMAKYIPNPPNCQPLWTDYNDNTNDDKTAKDNGGDDDDDGFIYDFVSSTLSIAFEDENTRLGHRCRCHLDCKGCGGNSSGSGSGSGKSNNV